MSRVSPQAPAVRTGAHAGRSLEAACRLFQAHEWIVHHIVSRFLRSLPVSREEYEDWVHEARVALWRAALSCTDRRTFRAYAAQAMRRALIDRLREMYREEERVPQLSLYRPEPGNEGSEASVLLEVVPDEQAVDPLRQAVLKDLLARAFALLPNDTYRQMLALSLMGYSRAAELAEMLGCTRNRIYSRKYHLRRYLAPLRAELRAP